eukprot:3624523-Rhodomonas_salina.1
MQKFTDANVREYVSGGGGGLLAILGAGMVLHNKAKARAAHGYVVAITAAGLQIVVDTDGLQDKDKMA